MSDNPSRLEFLPNEILLDTFQYFDAGDLYRAFYNLNSRFNALLRLLSNLCITLLTFNSNETNDNKIFSSYIHTLKLGDEVNINPNDFPNVRHLQLLDPSEQQLKQLDSDTYPSLEHLSIDCENILFSMVFSDLWKKILWNGFPYLKSCKFYKSTSVFMVPYGTQSSKLFSLQIGVIDIVTYKTILSVCPNLCVFEFTICSPWKESVSMQPHSKLKRMIIQFGRSVPPTDDCKIDDYLAFVPNLKELIVYRMVYNVFFEKYLNYNWLALYIDHHTPSLHQFKFYLSIIHLEKSFIGVDKNILNCVQESFKQTHNDRYQFELIIIQSALGC